jgi:hypothetical protein
MVKTTVELPFELWTAAKHQAVDEQSDLRKIIMSALEAYLSKKRGGKRGT